MTQKVRFITLGCKVNQYETQGMREALERAGVPSIHGTKKDPVDFVVINTCTVTQEADRENRYWIRRARREHPHARIVVTGCGVQRNRCEIESLPEVDEILLNHEKASVALKLLTGCGAPRIQDSPAPDGNLRHQYTPLTISRTEGNGRAFVKIQDGCNHACSFCKVVLVRGRSRSRNLSDIVDEVLRLRDSGYREIVFAGIQLGAFGLDLEGKKIWLEDVLGACADIEGIERLRLSSIEPTDVKPSLIQTLKNIPKCCHHLHIPLQSGDDEILKQMNRRYDCAFYRNLISELKSELSDFSLTLDVMAGFPGEEGSHFQNTVELLEEVRPLKCHVFPYSRRDGTRASRFQDLPDSIVRQRVQTLMDLEAGWGRAERLPYLGRTVSVLVEKVKKENLLQGLTDNYLKVCFEGSPEQLGQFVSVELTGLHGDLFFGRVS